METVEESVRKTLTKCGFDKDIIALLDEAADIVEAQEHSRTRLRALLMEIGNGLKEAEDGERKI